MSSDSLIASPPEQAGWVPWLAAGIPTAALLVTDQPIGVWALQSSLAFVLAWCAVRLCKPFLPAEAWAPPTRDARPAHERRAILRRDEDRSGQRAIRIVARARQVPPPPEPVTPEPVVLKVTPQVEAGVDQLLGSQLARLDTLRCEMRLLARVRRTVKQTTEFITDEINGDWHATDNANRSLLRLLKLEETDGLREAELRELRRELEAIRREAHRQHSRASTPPFTADTARTLAAAREALRGWLLDSTDTALAHLARRERDLVHLVQAQRALVRQLRAVRHGLLNPGLKTVARAEASGSSDVLDTLFTSLDAIERQPDAPDEPIVVDDDVAADDRDVRQLARILRMFPGIGAA